MVRVQGKDLNRRVDHLRSRMEQVPEDRPRILGPVVPLAPEQLPVVPSEATGPSDFKIWEIDQSDQESDMKRLPMDVDAVQLLPVTGENVSLAGVTLVPEEAKFTFKPDSDVCVKVEILMDVV
ncbi:hypothetical protein scyTo_0005830 [Scyliorhinus torazame]|uniref:Uncharacterized protein n=1 Tax=Scyliorhinus torazame TaxID=75743 RepID=A0A401PD57_SCYTO|nr:hypothetical protein [Scyliorhinus torazame]